MQTRRSLIIGRWFGYLFLAVCSSVAAWWLATWLAEATLAKSPTPAEPVVPVEVEVAGIRAPSAALRIGAVWEASDFQMKLPIRNVSGVEKRIVDVQAGCACVAIAPRQLTLAPGQTAELNLTIDLTRRAPWERHKEIRTIETDIRLSLDGAGWPTKGWQIEGAIRSRVTLDVEKLGFGDRPVAGSANAPRTIEARVYGSIGTLKATVVPTGAGSATLTKVEPGVFSVAIAPSASLPAGPFSFEVSFSLRTDKGELIPAGIKLPVSGVMQPEIRVFPAQVLLGPKAVGSVAETTVQLQSPPEAGWVVDRVEIDSPDLKIVPEGAGYRIRQQVTQEGDQFAVVRFFVRKGQAGKVLPVRMNVSYFGQKAKGKP